MAAKDQTMQTNESQRWLPIIFISYNNNDGEVAYRIKNRLILAGFKTIIDIDSIAINENISEHIKKCIKESGITLSLISKNSLMSEWVAMETIWSSYDETLRERHFIACYIDTTFNDNGFVHEVDRSIKERINILKMEIQDCFGDGIGIEHLTDELSRLTELKYKLPKIFKKYRETERVDLSNSHFKTGMERVIGMIKEKFPSKLTIFLRSIDKIKFLVVVQSIIIFIIIYFGLRLEQYSFSPNYSSNQRLKTPDLNTVLVTGCEIIRGDDNSKIEREKPANKVVVSDFYITNKPITQSEWKEIMRYTLSNFKADDNCPIEQVGGDDIQKFIVKLKEFTRKTYRQPTEEELECAAQKGFKATDQQVLMVREN